MSEQLESMYTISELKPMLRQRGLPVSGRDPDELDPLQTYDLAGWTAHYIINDAGNPQKVTTLVPTSH